MKLMKMAPCCIVSVIQDIQCKLLQQCAMNVFKEFQDHARQRPITRHLTLQFHLAKETICLSHTLDHMFCFLLNFLRNKNVDWKLLPEIIKIHKQFVQIQPSMKRPVQFRRGHWKAHEKALQILRYEILFLFRQCRRVVRQTQKVLIKDLNRQGKYLLEHRTHHGQIIGFVETTDYPATFVNPCNQTL